jgi:hypothetical protein
VKSYLASLIVVLDSVAQASREFKSIRQPIERDHRASCQRESFELRFVFMVE